MNIINSLLILNKELSETKKFNFDEYKLIGKQIAFLSYDKQKYFVKILMRESIQNINFTFYTEHLIKSLFMDKHKLSLYQLLEF